MQIDSYTGELLDTIDELGISENTIFIFTADNGPEAFDFEATNLTVETAIHGSPGPWRGTLFTSFEGSLRVPFVIRWPGRIAAGSASNEIVHEMDLLHALIDGECKPEDKAAGVAAPLQGRVSVDDPLLTVQRILDDNNVAVVINQDEIVGIVSKIDLITFLAARD